MIRTTLDLPDDLHMLVSSIARETNRTLSETITDLMRRGLSQRDGTVTRSPVTGLPVIRLGTVITTENVRSLAD